MVLTDEIVVIFIGFVFKHPVELDMAAWVGKGVGCFRGMVI